jgi:hypothetical protein
VRAGSGGSGGSGAAGSVADGLLGGGGVGTVLWAISYRPDPITWTIIMFKCWVTSNTRVVKNRLSHLEDASRSLAIALIGPC